MTPPANSSLARKWPLLALLCLVGCQSNKASKGASGPTLTFVGETPAETVQLGSKDIAQRFGAEVMEVQDPAYERRKRYRAVKLAPLLRKALKLSATELRRTRLLFTAADGYKVAIEGEKIVSQQAYLALGDVEKPPWEDLPGHRGSSPGPFYVVWKGKEAQDQKRYPWPWALTTVTRAPRGLYAKTTPSKNASELAKRGHTLFLRDCVRCHAINQQGGNLGPDLNVPRNVLEYREEKQLRAFIRNPKAFRYGNMPAQSQLRPVDLDAVIAYLRAMGRRKLDPASKRP